MNQTDKRIRQELEARRRSRDELRRKLEVVEGEVRLLELLTGDGASEPTDATRETGRKARTRRRLDAMAAILRDAGATGLGASDLAKRLTEATGEPSTRGAVDDLLKRYTSLFAKTPVGDKWRLREGTEGGAHESAAPA